ncbi:cyclophilin-like fold protein [Hymenobacter metallicola]|uniref:cyclophilin-like fold protein n=1 Tax=Hymenobacter metallicola TaxID=2563114 RepID=UPI001436BEC8
MSDLPRKPATAEATVGYQPAADNRTYYALWGNLTLFDRNFNYSYGLSTLGLFNVSRKALSIPGISAVQVGLERLA